MDIVEVEDFSKIDVVIKKKPSNSPGVGAGAGGDGSNSVAAASVAAVAAAAATATATAAAATAAAATATAAAADTRKEEFDDWFASEDPLIMKDTEIVFQDGITEEQKEESRRKQRERREGWILNEQKLREAPEYEMYKKLGYVYRGNLYDLTEGRMTPELFSRYFLDHSTDGVARGALVLTRIAPSSINVELRSGFGRNGCSYDDEEQAFEMSTGTAGDRHQLVL